MVPKVAAAPPNTMGLPLTVARPVDLGRVIQELEQLDDHLRQAKLRHVGKQTLPPLSRLLQATAELNKVDLLDRSSRQALREFLKTARAESPVLHMSFSADPSPVFMEKLMTWLRREIHPNLLVTVGLQPTLGAGCTLRTTNKYFDLSLRQNFAKKRHLLLAAIADKVSAAPGVKT